MKKYPLKLVPVPKDILWGGDRLKKHYNKKSSLERIAESWELCVRDGDSSVIGNGPLAGTYLKEYVCRNRDHIGSDFRFGEFPLLIKFIDAEDDLSIQVHPDESYAAVHPEAAAKNEVWYILEAKPGSEIAYGISGNASKSSFTDSITTGKVYDNLRFVPVKAGDVFYIPAGQVHAIRGGILIAEIQQNSDTTFRLYDYDRLGADGKKRELHVKEALEAVKCYTDEEIDSLRYFRRESRRSLLCPSEVLCDCEYFRVAKVCCGRDLSFTVDEKSFACLLFTDADEACVTCGGVSVPAVKGDCIFIPAGAGITRVSGRCAFLICEI